MNDTTKNGDGQGRFPFTTPVGSDATMLIQWKGTHVCLDFHCPCGAQCHLDTDFAYFVQCPHCQSVFEMGTQVIAKRANEPDHPPKVMEPDETIVMTSTATVPA